MRNSTKPTEPRSTVITIGAVEHRRRVQLDLLDRFRLGPGDDVGGQERRSDQAGSEQQRRIDQRAPAVGRRQLDDRGRDDGDEADDAGDQAELGVGLDELAPRCARPTGRSPTCRRRTSSAARGRRTPPGTAPGCRSRRPSPGTARPAAAATIMIAALRPPAMRSRAGPISGASRRNGAKLRTRNSSTRSRAASGSIEKNSESARATTIAASPAIISAWVIARRRNFEYPAIGSDLPPKVMAGVGSLTPSSLRSSAGPPLRRGVRGAEAPAGAPRLLADPAPPVGQR